MKIDVTPFHVIEEGLAESHLLVEIPLSSSPTFQHKNAHLIAQNILEISISFSKASSFSVILDLKRDEDSICFS